MTPKQLRQAALWHARMEDVPDGSSRDAAEAGLAAWRQTSDDHRRSYAAVAAAEAVARGLRHEPPLSAIGDAALARALAQPRHRPQWRMIALAGTLVVAPVAALTLRHMTVPPSATPARTPTRVVVTGPGERRVVNLGNAITVTLDTSSRLVAVGTMLGIHGQAYVSAGQLPATMQLRDGKILVQSGALNVRTTASGATIFAEGGMVTVTLGDDAADVMILRPGYVLKIGSTRPSATSSADPAAITSWRRGWLLFDDVPLEQAAAEINRYRHTPIKLARGVGSMRISGSFRTDGGAEFLDAVAATLPATIDRSRAGQATIVPAG